ncbi:MAG: ATP-binding protein, partial [Candidatus Fermentibacteria bacterium]
LMNLCVNSRDALPAGGSITIETRNVFIDTSFTILNLGSKPGRHILLSVTDNGCGIDEDTISSIFDPFFTTKTVGNGTGLGLSTVYGIVKQHNGDIQVYSEPDRGTVFSIYLPTVQRKAAHISPESNASVPIGMETILIAEDDDMVRNLTRETLVMAGYTVLDARNGEDALSIYHGNEDLIDLLILDVVMPGMGGKEVYNRIMESNPDIRTLFCSGYNRNAIHTGFVLDKDLHFIQKPFNSDVLLRKIRTILDS